MSLRKKTYIAILGSLAVLLTALFFLTVYIIQPGFTGIKERTINGFIEIEHIDAVRNGDRVRDAVLQRVSVLDIKTTDWSQWDDTWNFMADKNRQYLASNLNESALYGLRLNAIILFDTSSKVVASLFVNLDDGSLIPQQPQFVDEIVKEGYLSSGESDKKKGLIKVNNKVAMIAVQPILKSDGSGPCRGSIVFVRCLDDFEIASIGALVHLPLNRVVGSEIPLALSADSVATIVESDSLLSVYSAISLMNKKETLVLRAEMHREIFKQGINSLEEIDKQNKKTLYLLLVAILLITAIMVLVIGAAVEKLVLKRLYGISTRGEEIGQKGDFSAKLPFDGNDEIGKLSIALNGMLSNLEKLQLELKRKNDGMSLILSSIPIGLAILNEKLRVCPEYSASIESILGKKELSGQSVKELFNLQFKDGVAFNDYLELFRLDSAPEATMQGLNPYEELVYANGDKTAVLRTTVSLINRDKRENNHLLLMVEDITEKMHMAEEIAKSHAETIFLKTIAEDPDLYRDFLIECKRLFDCSAERLLLLRRDASRESLHAIFRYIHGIKGLTSSFGLINISKEAALLENILEKARATTIEDADELVDEIVFKFDSLRSIFSEAFGNARAILGDDIERGGITVRIPISQIKELLHEVQMLEIDGEVSKLISGRLRNELLRRLHDLQAVPARKGFARALKIIPGLVQRLGKKVNLIVDGGELPINCEIAHSLNTSLIHLIRNAVDHGLEFPEERLATGKSPEGMIKISFRAEDGCYFISVEDDGKGLNVEKIKAVAIKRGFITSDEAGRLSNENLSGLIFRPGFSTLDEATDISGRGVGLDAVLKDVREEVSGTISVNSKIGIGTIFTICIPHKI